MRQDFSRSPRVHRIALLATVLLVTAMSAALTGQAALAQQAKPPAAAAATPVVVAATVNGEAIFVAEVDTGIEAVSKTRPISSRNLDKAKADLLKQIINRRLVAQALEREGSLVTPQEIDKQINNIRNQAKSRNMELEEFVAGRGVDVQTLKHEIFWKLAWDRYLERHLTGALEEYFRNHKKDLDGTQIRASHILLRSDRYNETGEQTTARAEKIREEIESGKLTFEQAAQKYSQGPSRQQGGDLGFFPRYGVMFEEFSKAAYALEKGQISPPVTTPFGVHLIQCTDIKPGSKQWTEVVNQIQTPAALDLFEQFAKREREKAQIEYTGNAPYLDSEEKLVLPEKKPPVEPRTEAAK